MENDQKLFLMEILLHCADVSNPYKPFELCSKWADLVVFEFCAQGDREKKEGLEISPMMDRDTINLFNMQMGFIEFVCSPLIESKFIYKILTKLVSNTFKIFLKAVIKVFPALFEIGENMSANMSLWGNKRKEELSNIEASDANIIESQKIDERVKKFGEKMSFTKQMKEMCQFETNPSKSAVGKRRASISQVKKS